jgi:hypothetical protein
MNPEVQALMEALAEETARAESAKERLEVARERRLEAQFLADEAARASEAEKRRAHTPLVCTFCFSLGITIPQWSMS